MIQEVSKMITAFQKENLVDTSSSESVTFPYTLNLEFQQTLKFEEKMSWESDDR